MRELSRWYDVDVVYAGDVKETFFVKVPRSSNVTSVIKILETTGTVDIAADDWTIKMRQFFDHYLKGEPAPKWMLYGVPASKKGIQDGLELVREKDSSEKWITPGQGLLER